MVIVEDSYVSIKYEKNFKWLNSGGVDHGDDGGGDGGDHNHGEGHGAGPHALTAH